MARDPERQGITASESGVVPRALPETKPGMPLQTGRTCLACAGRAKMKKVMFLLPQSVGERLWEDGFLDALLEKDIDYVFGKFRASPIDRARQYALALSQQGCDAIIYPELHSSIFLWHSARRDWLCDEKEVVGIVGFLQLLERAGCTLLPMPMHYGVFDDFEVTCMGKPEDFSEDVRKKIEAICKGEYS